LYSDLMAPSSRTGKKRKAATVKLSRIQTPAA
jgi:hypothetical protein